MVGDELIGENFIEVVAIHDPHSNSTPYDR
jgi:hypothetical protein